MALPANSELVALAWLRSLDNIADNQVGTGLNSSANLSGGYITVGPVVGGDIDLYMKTRRPVLQVDAWSATAKGKADWATATNLAEYVRAGTEDVTKKRVALTLRTGYNQAQVTKASFVTEPQRIENDPSDYARIQFDLELWWTEV